MNAFMCALIDDVKALDLMLVEGLFETGVQRIGAEQELCLLDHSWRPAPCIMDVLRLIDDPHFTTEHSRYNLEINLDPMGFTGAALSELERNLSDHLRRLDEVLHDLNFDRALVGILPTIRRSDLHLENLTPLPRYLLLNRTFNASRGEAYEFRIRGIDELITRHNSIMFEGCNTSFQVHLQISPESFVSRYNWAQAIAGPVLAAATNSPLLLGKRLWAETRIALFQQSVDTRKVSNALRERAPRVTFGNHWAEHSISNFYREDLARYRVLVSPGQFEDSLAKVRSGKVPALEALCFHNGTVYRWNRACYGITDGKPHVRIENRILPAGPSVVDEIANAAFWLGLMNQLPKNGEDVANLMDFDDAKANFFRAAQHGLDTRFRWISGESISADKLILESLLPTAREGLLHAGIVERDADHYLGIIEERVSSGRTGRSWMLASLARLKEDSAPYESAVAITAGMARRQKENQPVHTWSLAEKDEAGEWVNRYWSVVQIMSTDFFTVRSMDALYYAANMMNWKRLRYIPVEDEDERPVGLITARRLLDHFSTQDGAVDERDTVDQIMVRNPVTVSPETHSVDALKLMREARVGCLLVVKDGKLVGLLTELNFMNFSERSIQRLVEESRHLRSKEKALTSENKSETSK